MKIGPFTDTLTSKVQSFKAHYLQKNKSDPDSYPLDIDSYEWEEQFLAYMGWGDYSQ